jgi:hypothetical protein
MLLNMSLYTPTNCILDSKLTKYIDLESDAARVCPRADVKKESVA